MNNITYLKDITTVPVIGLYDNEIIEISKKIASEINESINNINLKKFLGFDLKIIKELKNSRASYNFKDRVLEIHYNNQTSFIVPSLYCEYHHLEKYFNIKNKSNFLFESKIEERFKILTLSENITMKGDAGGIFSKAVKTGKKTAARFFKHEIKIENADSILKMASSINQDIERILGASEGKILIQEKITRFLTNANTVDIQSLYDSIFNANIQSKYVKEYKSNFEEFFNKKRKGGELFGKSSAEEIAEMIAQSYGVSVEEIRKSNALQSKSAIKKLKRVSSVLTNAIELIPNLIKSLLAGTLSFSTLTKGLGATAAKIFSIFLSKVADVLRWIFTVEYEKKAIAKPDENFFDSLNAAYENSKAFLENIKETAIKEVSDRWDVTLKYVLKAVDTSQEAIFKGLGSFTERIESLPYINIGKYVIGAILFCFFIRYTIDLFRNVTNILLGHKVSDEVLYARFNPEKLINNFGFDKIIVTEAITFILSAHIQKALQEGNFNVEEKARLKLMYSKLKSVYKEKCEEGIKFIVKEVK